MNLPIAFKKGAEAPLNFALKKSVARMLASYG
ncbi:Uncharacterised protein [Escherichia coli]|mgnify:CR=1 FL=1|jgi:hypothetical protein|nr:hypothetical protein G797_04583 [Escherichia coli HVH 139 (4-3192644)]CAD5559698.1 Uncharacterised protein [Escherichia coli]CTS70446.1 Uncharacterised protein [Escherichia coli]CTS90445.1 Uncharacterised protein [Escherichia coli]SQS47975.1 Uncharacterised protein [Escherichia coli]